MPYIKYPLTQLFTFRTTLHFLVAGIVILGLTACQPPSFETVSTVEIATLALMTTSPTEESIVETATLVKEATEEPMETPALTEAVVAEEPTEEPIELTAESGKKIVSVAEIFRVSVASDGTEVADMSPMRPNGLPMDISANGRYVVFHSRATGLDAADANELSDVFVHDMKTGTTERVSMSSEADDTRGESFSVSMSNDGQRITFLSSGLSIDGSQEYGIYLADRSNNSLKFVAEGFHPDISGDGKTIVFMSHSTELSKSDTNEYADVYAYDVENNTVTLISKSFDGSASNNSSNLPAVSQDGSKIAYISMATNLAEDSDGSGCGVLIYDMADDINVCLAGSERAESVLLSGDGKWVVFHRGANSIRKFVESPDKKKIIPGVAFSISADGNRIVYVKPPIGLYLYDVQWDMTVALSVALDGEVVSGYSAAISASGNAVVFESSYPELVVNDTNDAYDIFVVTLDSP